MYNTIPLPTVVDTKLKMKLLTINFLTFGLCQAASEEYATTFEKSVSLDGTTWSYQAMPNIIDFASVAFNTTFNDELLGWGDLTLQGPNDQFTGVLGATPQPNGIGGVLTVNGSLVDGKFHMRAYGDMFNLCENKTFPWVYDYVGFLVPVWNKPEQLVGGGIGSRYLVGSVIREIEHPGTGACPVSMHPAGQTGSVWMVLHQETIGMDDNDQQDAALDDGGTTSDAMRVGAGNFLSFAILVATWML